MKQSQTGGKGMKSKMLIATLLGCLVWQQGVLSQTDTIATDTNQSIGTSTANPPIAPAASTIGSSSATSSVAALTVVFPPSIAAQPASQTVVNGNNATFSVTAEGTPPLSYQWFFNGSAISGATAATYSIIGVTTSNEGNYTVIITNSYGSVTSSNITVDASAANPPAAPAATANESPTATTTGETTGASAANPPTAPAAIANESPTVTTTGETTGASAANPPTAPAAIANESPTVTTTGETTGASAANPPTAPAATANESPTVTTTGETTGASAANPPTAPAATVNESPTVTTTNESAGASAANPPTAPAAAANESPSVTTTNETAGTAKTQPSEPPSIPLIQFQDVPITTAIENLARQAGINYLIDPKIGYGQPDQNGQIKAEPTLSIRWENVTAEQALMALLDNYGLQLNEDRKTQIARITAKDPTAPPPLTTRVIQLKYASTSNMVDSVQASFTDKRSKVLPDVRTSQLVVVATEREQEALDALINELDKPTRQVLIETKLVQISSNPTTQKGIDWSGTLSAQNIYFGNGLMQGSSSTAATIPGTPTTTTFGGHTTTTTPSSSQSTSLTINQGAGGLSWNTVSGFTPAIGFLNADGVHAVLSFLNATYDAQIVSTPRIVTLDNEMATIEVTRGYPIINMAGGTANNSGSSSITYSNVGTILNVTPRISANDFIWLKINPQVSSFFGNITVTVPGGGGNPSTSYPVPEFDNRKIDSQVMIPNGNTLVMGGLVQDNPTATYSKVPLLGDIPGLGWAFRSESKSMNKNNLIIFLTPTIIKNTDFQQASSASADFLQSKSAVMKSRMNPSTVWDGAEPHGDWSNPVPVPGEFDKN
jgi:type II secretory pathway component GspD/PulD (secretin)